MASVQNHPQPETPIFVRPEGAARLLGISRMAVYQLLREGELPSLKMGRRRMIPREAVEAWARQRMQEAGFEVPDAPRD